MNEKYKWLKKEILIINFLMPLLIIQTRLNKINILYTAIYLISFIFLFKLNYCYITVANYILLNIICFMPFITVYIDYDIFSQGKFEYILFMIFLILSIYFLKLKNIKPKKKDYLITIFAIIIIFSTVFSVCPHRAIIGHYKRFEGMLSLIGYLILFYFSCYYGKFKNKYINLLIISSSIMGLYGIFQYFNLKETFISGKFQWGYQAYATIGNRNFLGSYITLFLPIGIFLYVKYQKKSYLVWSSILFLCMLCTFTRSAWLAFGVYSIALLYFIIDKRKYIKKLALIYGVFIIISINFNVITEGALFKRQISVFKDANKVLMQEDADSLGSGRIFIWKRAIRLIPYRPLLGSGPDTFDLVFMKWFGKECGNNHYYDKAHNEYLQIAVTEGIPALIIYLIIVWSIITKAYNMAKVEEDIIPILLSLIGYLVQAFFNISVVSVAPIYWIFLGYTAGIVYNNKKLMNN